MMGTHKVSKQVMKRSWHDPERFDMKAYRERFPFPDKKIGIEEYDLSECEWWLGNATFTYDLPIGGSSVGAVLIAPEHGKSQIYVQAEGLRIGHRATEYPEVQKAIYEAYCKEVPRAERIARGKIHS